MKVLPNRGTSILAALVFVGILGTVAYGVSALGPVSARSQVASSESAAPKVSSAATTPLCSSITNGTKVQVASLDDAKNQQCICKNPAQQGKPQNFETLKYIITASLEKGNPVAVATVNKTGETTVRGDQKCQVTLCKKDINGKQACAPASSVSPDALAPGLYDAMQSAPKQYVDDLAKRLAAGEDLSGYNNQLSDATRSQLQGAFDDLKTKNAEMLMTYGSDVNAAGAEYDKYSPKQLDSAQERLDSFATCGKNVCDVFAEGSSPVKGDPFNPKNTEYTGTLNCENGNCKPLSPDLTSNLNGGKGNTDPYASGDTPDAVYKSSAPGQTIECYDGGATCYPANQQDATMLQGKGFACTAEQGGNDAVCRRGTNTTITGGPGPGNGGPGPGSGSTAPPPSGGLGGGLGSALQSILGGIAKGLGGALSGSNAPACSSDPNAYAQQQQQYNAQLQQYNLQLQQYNMQQQYAQLNGLTPPAPPSPPQGCRQTGDSNTCPAAPVQPAGGCTNGSWRPVTTQQSNGRQCTSSWQCVPTGGATPTAQLSCQPLIADVGTSIAISYSCGGATGSTGTGFDTKGATSGSTTTVLAAPPAGANTATFGVTCTNQSLSAQAQCSVQIGRASIVLVANPKVVQSGGASTIGWITSGMQSCVISSPELPAFTTTNASNTSVNGMATTSALTQDATFLLHCSTVGGNFRDATTSVQVATSTSS